ncbi:hypothetical protein XENOCAPTIV_028041 [Xenoophorus captivus]|uniref:Uncharacterized protein n=1 Tax=Xenoophorus captivus TaxID=1517983 RepID=A0ABV0SBV9_9TELE
MNLAPRENNTVHQCIELLGLAGHRGIMEWPEEFPEDHAFVEFLIPGVSSDLDFDQFLKDTEEKLSLNASR